MVLLVNLPQNELLLMWDVTLADLDPGVLAQLHAGKALALEGISEWEAALRSYDQAMEFADKAG